MKVIITIIVLALLAWGGYALFNRDVAQAPAQEETSQDVSQSTPPATIAPEVKEFSVVGKNFSFSPANITVNKGDTVRIVFQNQGGTHDLVIDEFNARTKQITAGQSETIEFVADKSGTFEYYCSVGTHRQMGMKGTLVVQ